jgi:Membrane carboxypeptidase/penicillin-binding protein PbpC
MRGHRIKIGLIALISLVGPIGLISLIRPIGPIKKIPPPDATPVLRDIRGRPIAVMPTARTREAYPGRLRDFGPWLPLATVGIEDHRFWRHRGIDWHALGGSLVRNLRNGRVISGASTITQQLLKNTSPQGPRTLSAKVREIFTAWRLERHEPKERLLEAYLNHLDYGNRRIGPEAAARAYFGKTARDLTLAEAIYLAGLPQAPSRLNPWKNPAAALARYRRNVRRLAALGLLPEGTNPDVLLAAPPKVERYEPPAEAPHFAALVPVRSAPEIPTSLDLDLQKMTDRLLREHLAGLRGHHVGEVAAVLIDNRTGEVRALACAGKARHAAINAALQPRSCGSTLKPFLYLTALERRELTAASLLPDTPDAITAEYADYDPRNYSGKFRGPVRVREALGNSLNVPAVVTLGRLGARRVHDALRGWGLNFADSFDESGAGFILGNARVTLLDLAGAYAALARGGLACPPRVTPRQLADVSRVASPEACAIITDILCDPAARRTTFGWQSPLDVGRRTAVKTGTSSGFRDGWCVGFNRDHTVAVWAGNLDGQPMAEMLAVRAAAPLWSAIMRHLYERGDEPLPDPAPSEKLQSLDVAAETGLLPRAGEPVVREWFLAGTAPTEEAATRYSADGTLELPPEYARWCASPQNHLGAHVRSAGLKILFPRDGATFLYNENLPARQQELVLQSSRDPCEWFLNGRKLDQPVVPLRRGHWTLVARTGTETAETKFSVE